MVSTSADLLNSELIVMNALKSLSSISEWKYGQFSLLSARILYFFKITLKFLAAQAESYSNEFNEGLAVW